MQLHLRREEYHADAEVTADEDEGFESLAPKEGDTAVMITSLPPLIRASTQMLPCSANLIHFDSPRPRLPVPAPQ